MSATVFANKNGLFHKGSDGKGMAFPDVCLSPPPAPTGPVPIPYPNKASASDLAEGSTTVKVEGQPTALKDQSYTSTSTGDEGGTQGGGLITHKTKGKGYFKFWSFDVIIEGLNADCHSDPMGQNCGSNSINGLCLRSSVVRAAYEAAQNSTCTEPYVDDKHRVKPSKPQRDQAESEWKKTGKCWECQNPVGDDYEDDHFIALAIAWYSGGCHDWKNDPDPNKKKWKDRTKSCRCRPHCFSCSRKQSGAMNTFNQAMKTKLNL
jgi:hypothetical protein